MMQKVITMTSKGTFTLPAQIRKELGLNKMGDKLLLAYHPESHEIVIKKAADLRAMQKRNAEFIKAKGIKPVTDLNAVREQMYTTRYKNRG